MNLHKNTHLTHEIGHVLEQYNHFYDFSQSLLSSSSARALEHTSPIEYIHPYSLMSTLGLTFRVITLLPSVEMNVPDFRFKQNKLKFDKWCVICSNLSVQSWQLQVSIPVCLWFGSFNILRYSIMKLASPCNPSILQLKYKWNGVQIVVL
jgi:hypothetical protein